MPQVTASKLPVKLRTPGQVDWSLEGLSNYSAVLLENIPAQQVGERAMNNRLQGGCQVPIGSYSVIQGDQIFLRALVGEPDGSQIIRGEVTGPLEKAEELGTGLAEQLLEDGARPILEKLYQDEI